jgi:hypothetical protein
MPAGLLHKNVEMVLGNIDADDELLHVLIRPCLVVGAAARTAHPTNCSGSNQKVRTGPSLEDGLSNSGVTQAPVRFLASPIRRKPQQTGVTLCLQLLI